MNLLGKYVPSRPLMSGNIGDIESKLRDALDGRVEEAYLFGSIASGDFRPESDIDLILIKDSQLPFACRGTEFLDLFEIHPEIDILVYSRAELDRLLASPEPGFWSGVRATMRRIA